MKKLLFSLWVCVTVLLAIYFCAFEYCRNRAYRDIEFIDCSGDKFKADDGDSLYCSGKYVRILGIDTPETKHPEHGISFDQTFGSKAKEYATKVLSAAKTITLAVKRGEADKYDRLLAHVLIDGHLFAPIMIRAGLAYETIEEYGDDNFSPYAAEIMQAWGEIEKPLPFENPHDWREKNQAGR